jgi:hypothetical protein
VNLGELHRRECGRILASLIRVVKHFDLAEDALQEAFAAALAQWPVQGPPQNPDEIAETVGDAERHHRRHMLRVERGAVPGDRRAFSSEIFRPYLSKTSLNLGQVARWQHARTRWQGYTVGPSGLE